MLRSRLPWSAHVTGGYSTARGSSEAQVQYPPERSLHHSSGAAKRWDQRAPSSLSILRRPHRRGRGASDGGDGWSVAVDCVTLLVDRCTRGLVPFPCIQGWRSKAGCSTLKAAAQTSTWMAANMALRPGATTTFFNRVQFQ